MADSQHGVGAKRSRGYNDQETKQNFGDSSDDENSQIEIDDGSDDGQDTNTTHNSSQIIIDIDHSILRQPAVPVVPAVIQGNDVRNGILIRKKGVTSNVWNDFNIYSLKPWIAACLICKAAGKAVYDVVIGSKSNKQISTSKLDNHMRIHHGSETKKLNLQSAMNTLECQLSNTQTTTKINAVFSKAVQAPNFASYYVDWAIETFQPLNTCEGSAFRKMCNELNSKADDIGKDKVVKILAHKESITKATLIKMVKDKWLSITTDGWTSCANESYTALTGKHEINIQAILINLFYYY